MLKLDFYKASQHKWKFAELGQVVTVACIIFW